jgi:hypothetical protein
MDPKRNLKNWWKDISHQGSSTEFDADDISHPEESPIIINSSGRRTTRMIHLHVLLEVWMRRWWMVFANGWQDSDFITHYSWWIRREISFDLRQISQNRPTSTRNYSRMKYKLRRSRSNGRAFLQSILILPGGSRSKFSLIDRCKGLLMSARTSITKVKRNRFGSKHSLLEWITDTNGSRLCINFKKNPKAYPSTKNQSRVHTEAINIPFSGSTIKTRSTTKLLWRSVLTNSHG